MENKCTQAMAEKLHTASLYLLRYCLLWPEEKEKKEGGESRVMIKLVVSGEGVTEVMY